MNASKANLKTNEQKEKECVPSFIWQLLGWIILAQLMYEYLYFSLSAFQRWSAMTLQNETFVLDSSSTTTGGDGMNLVLRQGVLRPCSYNFTLHVTDDSLDGEGAASITLHHNTPPDGGKCRLSREGEDGVAYVDRDSADWTIHTLLDRVHFSCSGRRTWPHTPESQTCFPLSSPIDFVKSILSDHQISLFLPRPNSPRYICSF